MGPGCCGAAPALPPGTLFFSPFLVRLPARPPFSSCCGCCSCSCGGGAGWLGRNTLPLAAAPPIALHSDRQPSTPGTGQGHAWRGGRGPTAAVAAAAVVAAAAGAGAAAAGAVPAAVTAAAGQPGSGGVPNPSLHPAT